MDSTLWSIAIFYALMIITTGRVIHIWLDDSSQPIAAAFVCLLMGVAWPLVWLVYFINKGFSNPLKPW